MTNLEKLVRRGGVEQMYRLGRAICCESLIDTCENCPVCHQNSCGGTVEYYCEGTYEDYVKLADWALKEAE